MVTRRRFLLTAAATAPTFALKAQETAPPQSPATSPEKAPEVAAPPAGRSLHHLPLVRARSPQRPIPRPPRARNHHQLPLEGRRRPLCHPPARSRRVLPRHRHPRHRRARPVRLFQRSSQGLPGTQNRSRHPRHRRLPLAQVPRRNRPPPPRQQHHLRRLPCRLPVLRPRRHQPALLRPRKPRLRPLWRHRRRLLQRRPLLRHPPRL